jgi:hypothetical protein
MRGLQRLYSPRIVGVTIVAVVALWAGFLFARSSGIIGLSTSANGCVCHDGSPNANGNATVTITGPQMVETSSTSNYTIMVSGGPVSTTGGFNLSADGGSLIAGANNQLDTGELTHVDRDSRSWTFQWQAPATPGTYNLFAVAQATNGSGTGGDSWNWYGGQAGAGYQIVVEKPVQTISSSWGKLKAIYR